VRRAAFPGSFSPPTVAHLDIAEAALIRLGADEVHLVVSTSALGKDDMCLPRLEDRLRVLEQVAASRPWLSVKLTGSQLIADLAEGYDAVVLGADKWAQVTDPAWYGGAAPARDEAVSRLPRTLVVPRPPHPLVDIGKLGVEVLVPPADHAEVSSTAARAGRLELMLPEAAAFDARTGAWTDPRRYAAWLAQGGDAEAPGGSR
jgi:hypothetical protein